MKREDIIAIGINQSQKDNYYITAFMCKFIDTESILIVSKAKGSQDRGVSISWVQSFC